MPTAPDSPELEELAIGWLHGRPVLASGCGAVSTLLAEPGTVEVRPPRGNRYQAAGAE